MKLSEELIFGPCPLTDETVERLGPYYFIQKKNGHRLTQDSVLLTEFILPLTEDDSVIDIGTGAAPIPLMLTWRSEASSIVGVEVAETPYSVAVRNIECNKLDSRVKIIKSDFRKLPDIYKEGSFSVVVSNPPYSKKGSGRVSPDKDRALARSETQGTLDELLKVSRYLAGEMGKVSLIYPIERLHDTFEGMIRAGLRPNRLKLINTSVGKSANLFIIEAAANGCLNLKKALMSHNGI